MSTNPASKKWLALAVTLAVFAVLLALCGPPGVSAPLPDRLRSPATTMFGGGPSRNLVNLLDRNLPTTWNVAPGREENVLWSATLGTKAYGGPVVAGGKIFIGTNNGYPRDPRIIGDRGVMMCFDEKTGRFLWQIVHDKLTSGRVNDWPDIGIVSTPAVDGKRLYYVSNRCEVVCADVESGIPVWKLDMRKELNVFPHNASTCSPLLVGDLLFVVTGNGVDGNHLNIPQPNAPSFLAIDRRTGNVIWQDSSPGTKILHGQWSSPVYAKTGGTRMVVFPGGDGWLRAFDPPTGKLLWKFDCNPKAARFALGPKSTRNHFVATPVVWEDRLYIGVGDDPEHQKGVGHLWCVDLARAVEKGRTNPGADVSPVGDIFDPKAPANVNSALAWHYGGDNPKRVPRDWHFGRTLSTCAVHDGLVYAAEYDGWLHCLDARTGERYWDHDMEEDTWSSPYWVDGKVYLANDYGEVLVFEHGKKKKLLSTIKMPKDMKVRTTPVAANGVLYLVTENPCKLYALRVP
jgi:outer membrane protein assembly factor BamB